MRVYFRDQNPSVDRFAFKQSNARAAELVASGEGEYIRLSDGHQAVQLFRDQASREQWIERFEEVRSKSSSSPGSMLKYIPSPTCNCGGATHRVCGRSVEREVEAIPPTPQEIAAFMQSRELVTGFIN